MTKRSKLVKKALKNPSLFSIGELSYFSKWLEEHKRAKKEKKAKSNGHRSPPESEGSVDFS